MITSWWRLCLAYQAHPCRPDAWLMITSCWRSSLLQWSDPSLLTFNLTKFMMTIKPMAMSTFSQAYFLRLIAADVMLNLQLHDKDPVYFTRPIAADVMLNLAKFMMKIKPTSWGSSLQMLCSTYNFMVKIQTSATRFVVRKPSPVCMFTCYICNGAVERRRTGQWPRQRSRSKMETTAGVWQQSGFICSAADNFQHTQNLSVCSCFKSSDTVAYTGLALKIV